MYIHGAKGDLCRPCFYRWYCRQFASAWEQVDSLKGWTLQSFILRSATCKHHHDGLQPDVSSFKVWNSTSWRDSHHTHSQLHTTTGLPSPPHSIPDTPHTVISSSSTRPAGSQVGPGLFPWQPGRQHRGGEHRSALCVYLFRSFTPCQRLNQVFLCLLRSKVCLYCWRCSPSVEFCWMCNSDVKVNRKFNKPFIPGCLLTLWRHKWRNGVEKQS